MASSVIKKGSGRSSEHVTIFQKTAIAGMVLAVGAMTAIGVTSLVGGKSGPTDQAVVDSQPAEKPAPQTVSVAEPKPVPKLRKPTIITLPESTGKLQ